MDSLKGREKIFHDKEKRAAENTSSLRQKNISLNAKIQNAASGCFGAEAFRLQVEECESRLKFMKEVMPDDLFTKEFACVGALGVARRAAALSFFALQELTVASSHLRQLISTASSFSFTKPDHI